MRTTTTFPSLRLLTRMVLCATLALATTACSSWTPFGRPLEIKTFGMSRTDTPNADVILAANGASAAEERPSWCGRACRASWKWSGGKFITGLFTGGPAVELPTWATDTLEVRAWAPLPGEASGIVAAQTLSKRRAQDEALLRLAELIGKLPTLTNDTLRNHLRDNPAAAQRVEKIIREKSALRPGENKDKSQGYEVLARLDLMPVARTIWDPPEEDQAEGGTPLETTDNPQQKAVGQLEAIRQEAYLEAERKAHAKALESVQRMELFPGYTVRERMENDPVAAAKVQSAIREGKISDVLYPRPGLCELTYSLRTKRLLKDLK